MSNPLVSVIIPTKNSSRTLEACLVSVKEQSYENIEIIVVDNSSTDNTKDIARKYTDKVFDKGPERSAQRNYAVKQSNGEFVLIIDSDMVLSKNVVKSCVDKMINMEIFGLIIPEESFGEGLWAQCKKLERSFYVGIKWMEAARFFRKDIYEKLGGYNEKMVSGEDWDLSQRVESTGKIDRIDDYIYHDEGRVSFWKLMKKKYYYGKEFVNYLENNKESTNKDSQTGVIDRYKLFFADSKKLFKNPFLGILMLFMKTCELFILGGGYLLSKIKI